MAEQAKITLSLEETAKITVPAHLLPLLSQKVEVELTHDELERLAADFMTETLTPCRQALHDASLEVSDIHEVLMVGGQTRMLAVRAKVAQFFNQEPNLSINPSKVVALGAAVQAAILAGETTGLILADVVPLTLGVCTHGVLMDTVVPRNAPVPIHKTKIYTTAHDNQESVEIKVYQGERPLVSENFKLASFILRGIEPASQGEPEIQVTFQVDEDGILHVSAKEPYTGNSKEITITNSLELSEQEIQAHIRDAERYAAEYAHQRRVTYAQFQAKQLKQKLATLFALTTLPDDYKTQIQEALSIQSVDDWVTHTAHTATLQKLWQQAPR